MLRFLSKNILKSGSNSFVSGIRAFSAPSSFESAQKQLKTLKDEPDVEIKLKLYALFKQATIGDVTGSRPGMMDFAGRAKFDSWAKLKGTTKEEAQNQYAAVVQGLVKEQGAEASAAPSKTVDGLKPVDGIDVSIEGKVFKIALNRPKKFNSLTLDMYEGIGAALQASNKNKDTTVTVITGTGPYFCAGNDLSNFGHFATASKEVLAKEAASARGWLQRYVQAFIDHEKPLIGLINGPAIGIAVTVLGVFDYVIATDKATFHTPFAPLGQSPEGVSSYTFPLLMGTLRATELLLFCKKITAGTAKEYGLINEVIPDAEFAAYTAKTVAGFSSMPPQSLRINKTLMRSFHKKQLTECNQIECDTIEERWQSKECHQAIANFLSRARK